MFIIIKYIQKKPHKKGEVSASPFLCIYIPHLGSKNGANQPKQRLCLPKRTVVFGQLHGYVSSKDSFSSLVSLFVIEITPNETDFSPNVMVRHSYC